MHTSGFIFEWVSHFYHIAAHPFAATRIHYKQTHKDIILYGYRQNLALSMAIMYHFRLKEAQVLHVICWKRGL